MNKISLNYPCNAKLFDLADFSDEVGLLRLEHFIRHTKTWITSFEFRINVRDFLHNVAKAGFKKIGIRLPDIQLSELALYDTSFQKEPNSIIGHRGVRLQYVYSDYLNDIKSVSFFLHSICEELNLELKIILPYVTTVQDLEIFRSEWPDASIMIETPYALLSLKEISKMFSRSNFLIGTNDLIMNFLGSSRQVASYSQEHIKVIDHVSELPIIQELKNKIVWAGYINQESYDLLSEKGFNSICIDSTAFTSRGLSLDSVWDAQNKSLQDIRDSI